MTTDRNKLNAMIDRYYPLAEDTPPTEPKFAQTYALLIIARELLDIEGSLDTISLNVEGFYKVRENR